jgi:hypothetical protein
MTPAPNVNHDEGRPTSEVSAYSNNSGSTTNPALRSVRKKPVPSLDNPFEGSGSNALPLSTSIHPSSGPSASDNPYSRNILVDLSSTEDVRMPPRTSGGDIVEKPSDPFADPENPFADTKKEGHFSAHSDRTELSYASLTPAQIDQLSRGDQVAEPKKHFSMKSGLSYATLTSSQVKRRMEYPSDSSPEESYSERRFSSHSGSSFGLIGSVDTAMDVGLTDISEFSPTKPSTVLNVRVFVFVEMMRWG